MPTEEEEPVEREPSLNEYPLREHAFEQNTSRPRKATASAPLEAFAGGKDGTGSRPAGAVAGRSRPLRPMPPGTPESGDPAAQAASHKSFAFARNAGVEEGEDKVVAEHTKRGALEVFGAAYYDARDIEKKEYEGTSYVGVSYQISSVSLINSVTESFRVVIDLNFFYRIEDGDKEEYEKYQKQGSIILQDIVDQKKVRVPPPVFEIRNAIETPEESPGRVSNITQCYDHRRGEWSWYVNVYEQLRAECYEEFEMHRFPFTRNSLQVHLQSSQSMSQIMFVPFNSRSALPHWRYDPKAKEGEQVKEVFKRGNSLKIDKTSGNWTIEQHHAFFVPDALLGPMPSGNKFSTCIICIQCQQSHQFYLYNTLLVTMWLPILSMFCVVEDAGDIADRMSIVLTLLLTMATYKIVIADWIPQKDYLTFMDKYILAGFGVILFVALWVMLSAYLSTWDEYEEKEDFKATVENLEVVIMVVVGTIWVMGNAIIFLCRHSFVKQWDEILRDENKRLLEIAQEMTDERKEMQDVKMLSFAPPELPAELRPVAGG